jgi:hypothetical protein
MRCGNCHSKDVSYSKLKWWEAPFLLFLFYPYRCASCRRRMYRPIWFTPTTDLRQRRTDPTWQYGKQIHYRSKP